jgi:histone acetyltransferase (RNA polymerase elongator complex component)
MILPVFLPHLGCGDRCIYCNQDFITDVGDRNLPARIESVLASREGPFEVGLYGGNIFDLDPPQLRRLFSYFDHDRSRIANFRISTKPVPLNAETIDILKENRVTAIELGIPSFNDRLLDMLNRRHTADDLRRSFDRLTGADFQVALQVMVGLPFETWEDIMQTANNIIDLNPYYIRIYPLVFLKGTGIARMHETRQFEATSFEEVVRRALFIYLSALQHGIKTVKMGLTDNELVKENIIGGYYHPAFGHIVKCEAFYLAIIARLQESDLDGNITVVLNHRDIPLLLGHRRYNLDRFNAQGINLDWERTDLPSGTFHLKSRDRVLVGSIFDALAGLQ